MVDDDDIVKHSGIRELVFAGSLVDTQLLLNGIGVQPLMSLQLMSLSLWCSLGLLP